MSITRNLLTGLFVLLVVILGCSGNSDSLTSPSINPDDQSFILESNSSNDQGYELAGIWTIKFDSETLEATIFQDRHPDTWINLSHILIPTINVNGVSGQVWDVDITINNPYFLSGYDLRGILYTDDGDHALGNADDWTPLFDISGGQFINPFKAYAKEELNREFAGYAEHTENYQIYFPAAPYWLEFGIVVSYPSNCVDPYSIENFAQEVLSDEAGSESLISVDVLDWQDDVSGVVLIAPGITGAPFNPFTDNTGNTWSMTLVNEMGLSPGIYSTLVSATSASFPLYDFINVEISDAGWPVTIGGPQEDGAWDVVIDNEGSVFVTGSFSGTVDFNPKGGNPHTAIGGGDAYISKFDSNGNHLWTQTFGGYHFDAGHGVTIDNSGDVYVTGRIDITSQDRRSCLYKFDGEYGVQMWGYLWDMPIGKRGKMYDIVFDGESNIYVAGQFQFEIDMDPKSGVDMHYSTGGWDVCVIKLTLNGDYVWGRHWGTVEEDLGRRIVVDNTGDIYIVGYCSTYEDYSPDAILLKYTSSGTRLFALTWGSGNRNWSNGLAVDSNNNIYVTGQFSDITDFNPGSGYEPRQSNGEDDIYLSKFDSNGVFLSVITWGGPGFDRGEDMYIDSEDNIFVIGAFTESVDFNPGGGIDYHSSNGGLDVFISKFDSSEVYDWSRTFGGTGDDGTYHANHDFMSVTQYLNGLYLTGRYHGTVDFDPGIGVELRESNGDKDIFITKFDEDGNLARN